MHFAPASADHPPAPPAVRARTTTRQGDPMKSRFALLIAVLILGALPLLSSCDSVEPEIDLGTDDGTSTSTVLVYMIGSDLETQAGCATADLQEMAQAELGDRVNVVVQAGGAKKWQNRAFKNRETQRAEIRNGKLKVVERLGRTSMVDAQSLTDFVRWGVKNYPATSYDLILWDHGGGTLLGFGSDENQGDKTLRIDQISSALKRAGSHFGFIGFDACLMGTVETAAALQPYADYLIASEETEPGSGWYYPEWLTLLAQNPAMSRAELGKKIVHDYVNGPDSSFWDDTTLAVIDLDRMDKVYQELIGYLAKSDEHLRNQGFAEIATARSKAKSFGEGCYEQIDIVDYLSYLGLDGSTLTQAIDDAVIYSDCTITGANGLAMYYPYDQPDYYEQVLSSLENIGLGGSSHQKFFKDFVSIMVTGQYAAEDTKTDVEQLTDHSIPSQQSPSDVEEGQFDETSWYQDSAESRFDELEEENVAPLESSAVDVDPTTSDSAFTLQLSTDQWNQVAYIDRHVQIDDGSGYVELGYDTDYTVDGQGNVVVNFDRTWYTVGGKLVGYRITGEGEDRTGASYRYGYASALLNGVLPIDVQIYFDQKNPEGVVTGYRLNTGSGVLSLFARNLMQFEPGDKIRFTFDRYTYRGKHDGTCYLQKALVYDGSNLTVGKGSIDPHPAYVSVCLTDLFNTQTWSDPVPYPAARP